MRSLNSAVSGLRAMQTALDVIGNNIANVNTNGFKSSRTDFSDLFYQTLKGGDEEVNPTQVGYGSQVTNIVKDMSTTGATTTNVASDLFINGNGYFVTNTKADGSGTTYYTRVGDFHIAENGYLMDANGNYVMGLDSTSLAKANADTSGATDAELHAIQVTGTDGTGGSYFVSTDGTTTVKIGTADMFKQLTNITYNSDGTISAQLNGKTGTLQYGDTTTGGAAVVTTTAATSPFSTEGATFSVDTAVTPNTLSDGTGSIDLTSTDGDLVFVSADGTTTTKITSTNASSLSYTTAAGLTLDGSSGSLAYVTTGSNIIIGLASFANQDGLTEAGDNNFAESISSGGARYMQAGDNNSTSLESGALEQSNVDLATEFTTMITTQRGFQANSRVVTVSDSLLEEIVNLKRS